MCVCVCVCVCVCMGVCVCVCVRCFACTCALLWSNHESTFCEGLHFGYLQQGILKGDYHCTIDLLFDWFGISCMTTDNFCLYLQNRLKQSSQTGGQWYSDTSPFSILCLQPYLQILGSLRFGWKWLTVSNTLAYYDTATFTAVKSFIVQVPGLSVSVKASVNWSWAPYSF
jgi:hypothetical protein